MKRVIPLVLTLVAAVAPGRVWAHCQVPCGIYGDETRFTMLREEVTTIEKSMNEINRLTQEVETQLPNTNQMVRWVLNKEEHADELTHIVTYYFLAQRIKPVDPGDKAAFAKYQQQLTLLHGLVVNAMKAKQTTDLQYVAKLRQLIDEFEASYLGKGAVKAEVHTHEATEPHAH